MPTTDIYHISGALTPARKAVAFLGGAVDDAVEVDEWALARVAAGDTAGTISAWINVPDITGTYAIISAGDTAAIEFISLRVEAGLITIECNDATTDQYEHTTKTPIKPHRWYHITVVQDATLSAPKIYIDGVDQAPLTHTLEIDNGTWFADCQLIDDASIGASEEDGAGSLTNEFKGAISDVKYFAVDLTADEVKADYDTGIAAEGSINSTRRAVVVAAYTDHWDFDGDYVNLITVANNGTKVGDITLINNYSEFTSRLRYSPLAALVVADSVNFAVNDNVGHLVAIKAA